MVNRPSSTSIVRRRSSVVDRGRRSSGDLYVVSGFSRTVDSINMRYLLTTAVTIALSSAPHAQPRSLVEARAALSAAIAAQDRVAYGRLLSDDVTSVDTAGRLRNKLAATDEMPTGNSQSTAEIVDYGDGAVVLIGYTRTGESPARIIQAWAQVEGRWQMVAFQGVRASGVTPSSQASSTLPTGRGSALDRSAIQQTLEALWRTAHARDSAQWAALVTERYVATSPTQNFQNRDAVVRQFDVAGSNAGPSPALETSIRVYGSFAVANVRLDGRLNGSESWSTIVLTKDSKRWRAAAEITTPITGAARSTITDHRP